MSLAWRFSVIGLVVVIFAAAFVIGQTLRSSPPRPVVPDGYNCIPGSLIPQLKPGASATMTTKYGGFAARFRSSIPASAPANGLNVGMPFSGTLTMSGGGKSWVLPRPDTPNVSQINEMCVIAFHREQYPGVMIEGFTGGAHCCEVPVLYLFDQAEDRYAKVVDMSPDHYKDPHAFDANGGFIPRIVGGQVLLRTGDDRFAYVFGCYACGALPIVLDSLSAHGLTDVTGQHPSLVEADARMIWKSAVQALNGEAAPVQTTPAPFAFLAPWVADECTLGRGATAWSTIERLQHEGKLSDTYYYKETLNHGSFVANLHTYLLRDDYCTGQF